VGQAVQDDLAVGDVVVRALQVTENKAKGGIEKGMSIAL
jgi:hypothetical protein